MAYSKEVIDHYENPRNVGSLDKNDPQVGTGLVGALACGDVMKLQLKITEAGREVLRGEKKPLLTKAKILTPELEKPTKQHHLTTQTKNFSNCFAKHGGNKHENNLCQHILCLVMQR